MPNDDFIRPTGRLEWGDPLISPDEAVRETMKRLLLDGRVTLMSDKESTRIAVAGDYSQLEAYALAAMMHESKGPLVIELGQTGGQIAGILDESCIFHPRPPAPPAVKQNGRSAAYLALDPTKNKRSQRRGKR